MVDIWLTVVVVAADAITVIEKKGNQRREGKGSLGNTEGRQFSFKSKGKKKTKKK